MNYFLKKELPDSFYLLVDELKARLKKFGDLKKMQFLGVRGLIIGNFYYWKLMYKGHNLLVRVDDRPYKVANKEQTHLVSFSDFFKINWYFAEEKELQEITITIGK